LRQTRQTTVTLRSASALGQKVAEEVSFHAITPTRSVVTGDADAGGFADVMGTMGEEGQNGTMVFVHGSVLQGTAQASRKLPDRAQGHDGESGLGVTWLRPEEDRTTRTGIIPACRFKPFSSTR
jgi:hypothetical protein